MRCALPLLAAAALTACGDRRSFDERFDQTANDIEERARNIDGELNSQEQPEEDSGAG